MTPPPFDPNADTLPNGEGLPKREGAPARQGASVRAEASSSFLAASPNGFVGVGAAANALLSESSNGPLEGSSDPLAGDSAESEAAAAPGTAAASASPPASIGPCLNDDTLLAFADGRLGPQRQAEVDVHLDGCERCTRLLQSVAVSDAGVDGEPLSRSWATTFSKGALLARRFEILRFVEKGGMGEVYEALDRRVPGRVALKTVLCNVSDNPRALTRLCEELKLARRVAHRNVCKLYDVHEHQVEAGRRPPVHFLAMEFVDGETLKHRLRQGPIPLGEACAIAKKLLLGLSAAHAAGVLHLDFKSANVMLRDGYPTPEPVIMDFSLSRAFDKQAHLRTSERHLAGSIGYMSPEQLECRPTLDTASDIYSFGVVLFEMLTGLMPFRGDSVTAVMLKQLREKPPLPSDELPGLSPVLDAFVTKCLSRDLRERYANADTALLAFERTIERPRAASARQKRRVAASGLAVAVLVLGWGAHWMMSSRPSEAGEPAVLSAGVTGASTPGTRAAPEGLVTEVRQSTPAAPNVPDPSSQVAPQTQATEPSAASSVTHARAATRAVRKQQDATAPASSVPVVQAVSEADAPSATSVVPAPVESAAPAPPPEPAHVRSSLLLSNGKRASPRGATLPNTAATSVQNPAVP